MRMGSLRMFDVRWLRFDVKSRGASLPSSRAKFRDPEEVTLKLSRRGPSPHARDDEAKFCLPPVSACPNPAPPPAPSKRLRACAPPLLTRLRPNFEPRCFTQRS